MYDGYFTVKARVGGRFVGEAGGVLEADDEDGLLAAVELPAAELLVDVDGLPLAVGLPAVSTASSSPRVKRSAR
jgi:hypothetical protein